MHFEAKLRLKLKKRLFKKLSRKNKKLLFKQDLQVLKDLCQM